MAGSGNPIGGNGRPIGGSVDGVGTVGVDRCATASAGNPSTTSAAQIRRISDPSLESTRNGYFFGSSSAMNARASLITSSVIPMWPLSV